MSSVAPALAITFAIQAALSAGIYAPPVLAAVAAADLGVAASAVGVFTALAYLAATATSFVAGPLIARLGPMRVSQLCLLASGAGLAALATANLPMVLVGAILLGGAYGPATPASSQILVALTPPHRRATILSLKQTGVPAGGVAVGAILPWLSLSLGWRGGALLLGAVCLLIALACGAVRGWFDRAVMAPASTRLDLLEPLRLARREKPLRRLAVVAFLYSGVQLCFATYLVVYLVAQGAMTLVAAGAAMSAFMLGGLVGRVLWGAVADRTRRGSRVLAGLGLATGASSLALTALTPQWPGLLVMALYLFSGLTAIAWNGVQLAEVARHAPEGRVAAATAMSMMFSYLGVVTAPLAFWLLLTATGSYGAGFLLSAAFSLAGAVVLSRR